MLWCVLTPLSAIFQSYCAVSCIGGGNRRTWGKPPTCRKSLTNESLLFHRPCVVDNIDIHDIRCTLSLGVFVVSLITNTAGTFF